MKKQYVFKILMVVLLLSMTVGAAMAAPGDGEKALQDSLASLRDMVVNIVQLDLAAALDNLVGVIPFAAVFLALYGLFWWLGEITLFKDPNHAKFAHMFAIGLTLAAVIQGTVFATILSVIGGTFTTLVVIMIAVFMFIIALRRLRSSSAQEGTRMFGHLGDQATSKAGFRQAKHDLREMNQDIKKEATYDNRSAIERGRAALSERRARREQRKARQYEEDIRKAEIKKTEEDKSAREELEKARAELSNALAQLKAHHITPEQFENALNDVKKLINDVEGKLKDELKTSAKEKSEMASLLSNLGTRVANLNTSVEETKKALEAAKGDKEKTDLKHELGELQTALATLRTEGGEVRILMEKLSNEVSRIQDADKDLHAAIGEATGKSEESILHAIKALDMAKSALEVSEATAKQIEEIDNHLKALESKADSMLRAAESDDAKVKADEVHEKEEIYSETALLHDMTRAFEKKKFNIGDIHGWKSRIKRMDPKHPEYQDAVNLLNHLEGMVMGRNR